MLSYIICHCFVNWAAQTSHLETSYGDGLCEAVTQNLSVPGGTISAYLINSSGTIITDYSSVTSCPVGDELLGVMNIDNSVNITSTTKG